MADRSWVHYALIGGAGLAAGVLVYHLFIKRQEEKRSTLSVILDAIRGNNGGGLSLPGMKGWRGIHGLDVETPRVRDPNYYVGRTRIAEAAEPPGFPFDDDSERRVSKQAALIMQYL